MFPAAFRHPWPLYRFRSPSRSSTASADPLDAPAGTDANPVEPPVRSHHAPTVGLPRLSRSSWPTSLEILTKPATARARNASRDRTSLPAAPTSALGLPPV